ncbi:MFS transporter [Pseudarthrobacter phenanthrenivorans]|uniref:Major facilitator transporter n=1 Tax=Pseudarthrobacter phenanthrenivorans TaxID=361575 RepID=A0A0B4EGD6_PSEPS|nr:aromatic acid/H+ symport family MFS transporter [Pseudarthrobacter phenanthrenivorans]KIC65713.1 major facilitator transporter [Pseudarthrobacter phenanthrenivorans]
MTTLPSTRASRWPVWLCWLAMVLDGFDLVVLGTVIPTLIKTGELGFDAVGATLAATISLVGVGLGALFIAPLSDRFGHRRLLVVCVLWFSVFTISVIWAPNVAVFSAFRLLAGLGLGACLPVALAYMNDYAPAGSAGKSTTRTMTGYHAGAVATAFLALMVIPDWRTMFVVGGLAGFALVPFLWFKLPETAATAQTGQKVEQTRFRDLARKPYPLVAAAIAAASFMGLLLVYGLNTWLPQLMASAGYPVTAGISLLLVLNLGAVAGLIIAGILADRHGTKPIVLLWFGLSAACLALLSIKVGNEILLNALVFVTGVFVFSSQVLVYAWVSQLFPARLRATALGFAAGVGRVGAIAGPAVTGGLVAAGIAYPWGFYVFAAAGALAVVALVAVPHAIAAKTAAVEHAA